METKNQREKKTEKAKKGELKSLLDFFSLDLV